MSLFARQLFIGACAGLLLCSWFALGHAQPGSAQAGAAAKRERVKQKVRAMRAYVLTDALALDPSTAGKMFPVIEKYDNESDAMTVARAALRIKLDATADSKTLNKVIDDLLANQKALFDMEAKRLVELRAILTPQQIAKLITVLPDFERRLQNRLGKAKGKSELEIDRRGNPFSNDPADADPEGSAPGRPGGRKNRDKPSSGEVQNPFNNSGPGSAAGKAKRKCDPFGEPNGC